MEKILSQSVEMLRLYIVTQNCVPMQVTRLPNCVHIVVTTHIETGNTKLSLPVLVNIAEALSVQTDALLYDTPRFSKTVASEHIQNLLDSCTTEQLYVIIDTLEALKVSLDKHVGD